MGNPIDYIVFDWRNDKTINLADGKVVMLDVKSGKSQLTTKQRRIRDLIQAGKEWSRLMEEAPIRLGVKYVPVGGNPCRRQCDVDKETLVCKSCGLSYKKADEC